MRKLASSLLLAGLMGGASLFGAGAKSYQVTGPVMDIQGEVYTIQKGTELWQINVPKGTKGFENVKKGDKVTIYYTMTATSAEAKPAAPAKASKK